GAPPRVVASALDKLGYALLERSRMDEAIECFDRILAMAAPPSSMSAMARFSRGFAFLLLGRTNEALADFGLFFSRSDETALADILDRLSPSVGSAVVNAIAGLIVSPEQLRERVLEFVGY